MDEISEIKSLMDPPVGLTPRVTEAARHRLLAEADPDAVPRKRLFRRPSTIALATCAAGAAVAFTLMALSNASIRGSSRPAPGHSATIVPAAYTISRPADGVIEVNVRRFADAKGLERELRSMGLRIVIDDVPRGMDCRQPRTTHSLHFAELYKRLDFRFLPDHSTRFIFYMKRLHADETVVVQAHSNDQVRKNGEFPVTYLVAKGPVRPCVLRPGDPYEGRG